MPQGLIRQMKVVQFPEELMLVHVAETESSQNIGTMCQVVILHFIHSRSLYCYGDSFNVLLYILELLLILKSCFRK